jgi:hypothetical protein
MRCSRRGHRPRRDGRWGKAVGDAAESRGGSAAEAAGAAQALGGRSGLALAALDRELREEIGGLGDHL